MLPGSGPLVIVVAAVVGVRVTLKRRSDCSSIITHIPGGKGAILRKNS